MVSKKHASKHESITKKRNKGKKKGRRIWVANKLRWRLSLEDHHPTQMVLNNRGSKKRAYFIPLKSEQWIKVIRGTTKREWMKKVVGLQHTQQR